jgi:hypothetical protein
MKIGVVTIKPDFRCRAHRPGHDQQEGHNSAI